MTPLSQLGALLAIVGTGIVYGTDAFCALVQRSALARVDDATLTAIMGRGSRPPRRICDRRSRPGASIDLDRRPSPPSMIRSPLMLTAPARP